MKKTDVESMNSKRQPRTEKRRLQIIGIIAVVLFSILSNPQSDPTYFLELIGSLVP